MAKEKQETKFSAELLDELLEGQDAATVLRSDGLVGDLKRALAERMLNAEMDVHLGGETEQDGGNHRNACWLLAPSTRTIRASASGLSVSAD